MELQQRAGDPLEFIDSLKIDLFPDDVYVFTPKGDIMELPRGACPVDFAYAVHTDIGNHCIACRIDRALAPLSQQLESGQSVEIITAKGAKPSPGLAELRRVGQGAGRNPAVAEEPGAGRIDHAGAPAAEPLPSPTPAPASRNWISGACAGFSRNSACASSTRCCRPSATAMSWPTPWPPRLLAAADSNYEAVPVEHEGPMAVHEGEGLVVPYRPLLRSGSR